MTNENIYKNLMGSLNAGKKAVLVTAMGSPYSGKPEISDKILVDEDHVYQNKLPFNMNEMIFQSVLEVLKTGDIDYVEGPDKKSYLIEPYFPETRLIVFGGGHIAKPLVEFGAKVGFSVTVIDDRPMFANEQRFPDAEKVICEDFIKSFDSINLNSSAFVVIVTRGHRHDIDCLRQVLKYNTAYVGMIGSRRRVKSVKEQLLSEGYSSEKIEKVNAPIGIRIGAITPEEIAISIIAQIISCKRLDSPNHGDTSLAKQNWPEYDREVLLELGNTDNSKKAVVTVISTKGSTPRKSGAKMIVWPDGRTIGSIGGGCSEGEVIRTALDVIRDGGYKIQRVDMTGDIAEEDGMVCGGIMQVLIESY
ncbi:MAG: XdhC/CoxI family protein [Thermotaleaceae bacterium]